MGCNKCGGDESQYCEHCEPAKTGSKHPDDYGMSGDQIFRALDISLDMSPENAKVHLDYAHIQMLFLHARALSAHCECLGMNAENMWAAIANTSPAYQSSHYFEVMQKWGLIDDKGGSLI